MLFDRSDIVPIRSQRVPQSIETPVTFVSAPGVYLRYTYSRSSDSMASGIDGQDYLCFQHNDQKFVFVVADGVGSSFCGNLAARILGDGLLEWLWAADIPYFGAAAALGEAATSALNRLQKQAHYEVEAYEIPGQISPLVRQALEAQRAYGSEAIFAAMRIDHPSPTIPDGLISLCWMGDTQVHLIDLDGQKIEIGGRWENANRWSTTQGVRGAMSAWMRELSGIGRIVAFTDGLAGHASQVFDDSDDQLDREIRAGARLPTSDDVALIDVITRTARYEGYPDPDLPDPNLERPQLEPIWNPTGTGMYELRWTWAGEKNASFMIQEATNPALSDGKVMEGIVKEPHWGPDEAQPPGHYYYRVRAANRRGVVSPWSELRQTKVAYPPPPAPELSVDQSGSMPTLMWQIEGESLDFLLQEAAEEDFEEPKTVYSGRNTSWAAPPGYPPGAYYYRVQAVSDGGAGSWSEPYKLEIVLPPPPRPHITAASDPYRDDGSSYELHWQAAPGATYYEIEEANTEGAPARTLRRDDTVHRVSGQPPGEYVYRARACHEHGCSDWSNALTITVSERPPAEAPDLTRHEVDADGPLIINWAALPDADAYEVEISDSDRFDSSRLFTSVAPSFSAPGHEPGEVFARVRGVNAGGDGPWSASLRLAIPPGAPARIETLISEDGRRIGVQWAVVEGPVTYSLELSSGSESDFREVYRGSEPRCEISTGEQAMTAVFRVRAEVGGAASDWRTADPVSIAPSLTAPTLGIPEIGEEGEAALRWTPVSGAARYILEVSRSDQFGSPQRLEGVKTAVTFHPPASGRYWFRVRAAQTDQIGPASNIVSIEAQRPTAPSLWPIEPVKANSLFEIAWTAVPGGVYYELQGTTSDQFEPDKTATTRVNHPSLKYSVPGRSAGRYFYRVRAVDAHQQASVWSNVLVVEVQ
jgi:Protein phosphatase 2C